MKGDAVERLAGRDELDAVLLAGDDRADVDPSVQVAIYLGTDYAESLND